MEDNNHWELLGFKVESGESKVGDKMIISRPIEHTPNIINQELGIYTIKVQAFSDYASECRYVAQCITNDIQDQKLRPDDICVICLDNGNIKSYYSLLSKMLIKTEYQHLISLKRLMQTNISFMIIMLHYQQLIRQKVMKLEWYIS